MAMFPRFVIRDVSSKLTYHVCATSREAAVVMNLHEADLLWALAEEGRCDTSDLYCTEKEDPAPHSSVSERNLSLQLQERMSELNECMERHPDWTTNQREVAERIWNLQDRQTKRVLCLDAWDGWRFCLRPQG